MAPHESQLTALAEAQLDEVLSFLFNSPSTGGGNMHTAGLVEIHVHAGYDVRHFYAGYPPRGIGRFVGDELPASTGIAFSESDWKISEIQRQFRAAVDSVAPDHIVISNSWNTKPHLAEAICGVASVRPQVA
jgi:hypothetical protein